MIPPDGLIDALTDGTRKFKHKKTPKNHNLKNIFFRGSCQAVGPYFFPLISKTCRTIFARLFLDACGKFAITKTKKPAIVLLDSLDTNHRGIDKILGKAKDKASPCSSS